MPGALDVEDYFISLDPLNFTFTRNIQDINVGNSFLTQNSAEDFIFKLYRGEIFEAKESLAKFKDNLEAEASTGIKNDFVAMIIKHFKLQHGVPLSVSNLGDFQVLFDALGLTPGDENAFLEGQLLTNAFNYFITHYDFTLPAGGAGGTFGEGGPDPNFNSPLGWRNEFLEAYEKFLTSRASVDDALFPGSVNVNLSMYERIFNEFVVQPPIIPFEDVLKDFYNTAVERDGFFLPSHHLKDWMETVQLQQAFQAGIATSVAGTNSGKTAILLILFRLLVEVIDVLQRVAAAQGERLRFYAGYQKGYTDLIGEIPIITERDVGDSIRGDSGGQRQKGAQFAQAQNQSFTEKLRALRSILGDEAKQHQTSVKQSNEIVTQQANLGTSILQQMSTILTNMFK